MKDVNDNSTCDLWGEAGAQPAEQPASQQISSLLPVDLEQVQQQAISYATNEHWMLKQGYNFAALYTYDDLQGEPLYWRIRLVNENGKKKILPFCLNDGRAIGKAKKPSKDKFINAEPRHPEQGKPLYGLGRLGRASAGDSIIINEGEKCADIASSIAGIAGLGFSGAKMVANTDFSPLAGRSPTIAPDNDSEGIEATIELIAVLQTIGCNLLIIDTPALSLPKGGAIDDWIAQRNAAGLTTTRADIEALPTLTASEFIARYGQPEQSAEPQPGSKIPKGHLCEPLYSGGNDARFEVLPHGIFYIAKDQHDNERAHFICSPVLVIAKTRDTHGNAWGRLLQWHDDERRLHQWAMPMQLLQGDGSEVRRELADQGVTISPERKSRDLLTTYLNGYPSDTFALCVDRLGWHGLRYVMPQHTYGEQQGQLTVFQQSSVMVASFYPLGSLADWQQQISQPCANHSRLVFALACAFAGQLLEPLNEQGGGFHIRGDSSSGKSTALKLAGSVWGDPEQVIRQWRATSNALEGIAALHNDNFLGLDEIGQCNAKDIGDTVYMLSNGQGKARMQRTGITRPVSQWRVMFLSNGEESLAAIMQQTGKRTNAGQEIRLADIPADAGHGLGIFDPLSTDQPPAAYAEQLKQASASSHGTAGIAWLEYLTSNKAAVTEQAQVYIQQFMQDYASSKNGQVQRVARRFAIVAAAGELATLAGITAWQQGRAIEAIGQCFNAWLDGFGDGANLESRNILAEVKAFFEAHGSSRFENMQPPVMNDGSDMLQRIINRVGYYRQDDNSRAYLVYPEQFKSEICQGRDPRQVAKVLNAAGWLDCDTGKNTKAVRLPDIPKTVRMYAFNAAMWQWENEASTDTPKNEGNKGNMGNNLANKGFEPVTHSENEKVTEVTKQVTALPGNSSTSPVTPCVTHVTQSDLEQVTAANPSKIGLVTPVTSVTPEKQSNQTDSSRRAVL